MSFGIPVRNGLGVGLLASTFLSTRNSTPFSPASLFAAGEPGAWYDPSDLSTLYQDSAGTTPVTAAAQSVGLMLDKSQGLVLGPELVTNGDFSSGTTTGWAGGSGATLSVVDGRCRVDDPTGSGFAIQTITTVVGKLYRLSGEFANSTATAQPTVWVGTSSLTNNVFTATLPTGTNGTWSYLFTAASTTSHLSIGYVSGAGQRTDIDNISIKELPGNHAFQSNSAQRPTYGVVPATGRRNLLTYTEDLTNAVWLASLATKNTATKFTATIANNIHAVSQNLTHTSGVAYTYQQVLTYDNNRFVSLRLLVGVFPHVCFDLINGTIAGSEAGASGTITSLGGGSYLCTITVTATSTGTGNASVFLQPSATNYGGGWLANGTEAVTMTNAQLETGSSATAYQRVVSSFDVTEAGVQTLSYVSFDGTDDGMLTNTITPGIDKVQVFAGVRKLSDANYGMIAEIGTQADAQTGAFNVTTRNAPGYGFGSRGTAWSEAVISTGYASPITNVLTGIGDIAGDVATLRINGTQVASNTADQGTGNYLAYPLYIGRRAGATLPLNGQIYSMIVRFGSTLSAATILQTETYVGDKTGINIPLSVSPTIYDRFNDTVLDRAGQTIEVR